MHQSKWDALLDQIEKLFGFIDHTIEEIPERHLTIETAVFDGAAGRMMLERSVKPVVLDKKTTYSKRIGGEVTVEYILSDDEFVDTVKCYKWDKLAREWKPVDIGDLGRY